MIRYILIALMIAGVGTAGAGTRYMAEPNLVDDPPPFRIGMSYHDATDNTWHLYNGDRWLLCGPSSELIVAAEGVLPYLGLLPIETYAIYRTPAGQLRHDAERIEEMERAIKRFRDALDRAK